jgi:outer membrane protein
MRATGRIARPQDRRSVNAQVAAEKKIIPAVLLPVSWILFAFVQLDAQSVSAPAQQPGLKLVEAVQSTLQNHPLLMMQKAQVEISRGQREQASSVFDSITQGGLSQTRSTSPTWQSNSQSGLSLFDQVGFATDYTLSFDRLFRNGVTAQTTFGMARNTESLTNQLGLNTSVLNLTISLPLLRGRGRKVVAAQEEASIAEMDATLFDTNQFMSRLIATTVTSYWNLVAARKSLAIAVEAEERGRAYLETVQELVAADHVPRNDLNNVTANLAQRTAARIALEQEVVAAQAQLALDMGMQPGEILNDMAELADDFPAGENQRLPSNTGPSLEHYLAEALDRRADYLAAKHRNLGSKILLTAARNRTLPQLNLNLGTGYSGMGEGRTGGSFFSGSYNNVGPNAYAGISYVFSGKNQAARGALRQADAATQQAAFKADELARNVSADVVTAVQGVRNAILRLKKAREAVEAFQDALAGQREKYRAAMGSIIDVLTVEDRLNNALSEQVQAQQAYALALIQFRFATGTILSAPDKPSQTISIDALISLPFDAAPGERR